MERQEGVKGKHSIVSLLSEAACPPSYPARFALKLLSVFFTQEEMAKLNCTKADDRKLLNQDILQAINSLAAGGIYIYMPNE